MGAVIDIVCDDTLNTSLVYHCYDSHILHRLTIFFFIMYIISLKLPTKKKYGLFCTIPFSYTISPVLMTTLSLLMTELSELLVNYYIFLFF